jgi:SprT-like family
VTKLTIARLILMGMMLLSLFGASHHHHKQQLYPTASQVNSNATLERWYKADNETYFDDKLPHNVSVKWADIPREKDGDVDMGDTAEDVQHRAYAIRIDRMSNVTWGTTLMTLRHEECHAAEDPYLVGDEDEHGPRFQSCMINLAKAGAFKDSW